MRIQGPPADFSLDGFAEDGTDFDKPRGLTSVERETVGILRASLGSALRASKKSVAGRREAKLALKACVVAAKRGICPPEDLEDAVRTLLDQRGDGLLDQEGRGAFRDFLTHNGLVAAPRATPMREPSTLDQRVRAGTARVVALDID